MVQAARKAGKLLMVAHVLPFVPEFAFAAEAIRGGAYGKLLAADFQARHFQAGLVGRHRRRRQDRRASHRPAHPRYALHRPRLRRARQGLLQRRRGERRRRALDDAATCTAPAVPAVTCTSGALAQKGRPFVHGFEIFLEKATLLYEAGTQPLTVLTADGKVEAAEAQGRR